MIMVTGSSGALGGEIVEALLRITRPEDVAALVRTPSKVAEQSAKGVTVRQGDFDAPDSLIDVFEQVDTLVLIPTIAPIEQRMKQNRAVIDAACRAGLGRVIFVSFMDVRPDSVLPYAIAFADTEQVLKESGLNFTIMRMALYMDNFYDWPVFQPRNGVLSLASGNGRVAYVSRRDLADSVATVALKGSGHEGKTYEITGPAALDYHEIANILSDLRGEPVRYQSINPEEHYEMAISMGMPEYLCKGSVAMATIIKEGVFNRTTEHVASILGRPAENIVNCLNRLKGQKLKMKGAD